MSEDKKQYVMKAETGYYTISFPSHSPSANAAIAVLKTLPASTPMLDEMIRVQTLMGDATDEKLAQWDAWHADPAAPISSEIGGTLSPSQIKRFVEIERESREIDRQTAEAKGTSTREWVLIWVTVASVLVAVGAVLVAAF